ncbi:MAG: DUF4197 domain-containing protein [Flavobacteriales bacterium]|nr:DUF4197 domain-containing protein [Flavobacteriales bacterium]
MKFLSTFALALIITIPTIGQNFGKFMKDAEKTVKNVTTDNGTGSLSEDEIIKGLKEALAVGSSNAGKSASQLDGFYKNDKIKIPFPPEVDQVRTTVEKVGLKPQVDKFVETLNRAAEEAAKEAAPIFVNAITSMNINDGMNILNGGDRAATTFLQDKTSPELKAKFEPIVKAAIEKVQLTKYWNPIINQYNKVPMVKKVNPDLDAYVLDKALDGLFTLVAEEEAKIRKDPAARVSDILKKVFGN